MRFWNSILKLDLILASFFSHRFLSLICKSYYISRYSNDNNVAEDVNLENEIIILISFAIHYCVCVSHTHRLSTRIKQKKKFSTIFFAQHNDEKFSGKFFDKTKKKKNLCKFFILHAWSPFIQPNQNQTNRFPFTYFCCCCCFEFCQNRQKKTYLLISTRSRIEGVIIYSKLENKKIPENEMCSSSFFIMKIKNLCRESFFFLK